ncbi:4-hydroxy-tetrahydrodipicolinate synthase [Methanogenium sp. MK-MG]|uniref:4-hydroxy-tetrahydrodipicolinate synthase n=1 Tax=Methanogenium sp. MK-MG TaxID=2599926 RepID=UPI0013EB4825|nr:4-hydroxy-tetrahydrodipicolinate synthase [Methanogenium sp. MK-MG]KAF1079029.1 4-hydroxy-tetrahydrodipicolinate synthase [Methanogenium sp. MK-MG]
MFEGVYPALITPFEDTADAGLNLLGLRANIEYLIENGVHGVVPCGSTGESATLTFEEHEIVIGETIDAVNGRVPVVAGTGSNNTAEALRFTKSASDQGADAVLVLSPYYNKPNRSGLIKHYTRIADIGVPVIIYNVPSRTGQNLTPDLITELAAHPGIVGVKEASGDINQISEIIEGTRDKDFSVFSGDDAMTLPVLALGGAGVITVTANVEPARFVALYERFRAGDYAGARDMHYELSPLMRALFIDTNPIPVKRAVGMRGMAAGPLRLPLDSMTDAAEAELKEVLSRYD